MDAISEGKLEEAIENLTKAILLNPISAIMYSTRASVYIKMKKPNAAIRDANAALEINPDSAKGYKPTSPVALHEQCLVEPNYTALRNAIGSMIDFTKREKIERLSVRDGIVVLKLRLHMRRQRGRSNHPPVENLEACLVGFRMECLEVLLEVCLEECLVVSLVACQDPELMVAFSDPEVMAALQDIMKNSPNLAKHQANPKVAPIIAKMKELF
ncbi:hypothetical protein CRYUN_Cryun07bG0166500 [Craigia yunnanensis]